MRLELSYSEDTTDLERRGIMKRLEIVFLATCADMNLVHHRIDSVQEAIS